MSAIPIMVLFLLLLSTPPVALASSFSFFFPSFGPADTNTNINCTGDAYISSQGIQVTPDEGRNRTFKVGRATYIKPFHLWDRASRRLTGFSTNFSFVIDSERQNTYGDGLAFIMVPLDSVLRRNFAGGGLGYGSRKIPTNTSAMTYVAVEFDTFVNDGDPPFVHAGININSLRSNVNARWDNNITGGSENTAWISYNANSMVLKLDFTDFSNSEMTVQSINQSVDLRDYLPEHVMLGFSAATGGLFQTNNVKSWNFSSMLDLDNPLGLESKPGLDESSHRINTDEKQNKTGLIVGVSIIGALVVTLALACFFIYCVCRRKKRKDTAGSAGSVDMDNEFEKGRGPKKFSYEELFRATSNFSEKEKLGEGGFGGVYRGFLRETDSDIAVKRVSQSSKQGLKEYVSEVKIISQLRHKNLVELIGWCHERGELFLVYEFMPKGSLDFHLFKGESVLPWEVRYKIALGLADALLYLHELSKRCVLHRDIKTSNIMLDSSFDAKLGDFGLARFVDHDKESQTTDVAGTRGYMAPEYIYTGRATKESDIYSFGVVLLEIACGRRTFDRRVHEEQMVLAKWMWGLYGSNRVLVAADSRLSSNFDEQEMERLMVVGLWCVHLESEHRPSIEQARSVLKLEAEMPTLVYWPETDTADLNGGEGDGQTHTKNSDHIT